jgi:hypothetical protein
MVYLIERTTENDYRWRVYCDGQCRAEGRAPSHWEATCAAHAAARGNR